MDKTELALVILDLRKKSFTSGKYLLAGVFAGSLQGNGDQFVMKSCKSNHSLKRCQVGRRVKMDSDKLVMSTSCSLLHTAVDIVKETKLDDEIISWLAFQDIS
ncbi:hypothetical protein L1987_61071 [Smallanthus sonchifolius]|uniref:Uncharacterized protein n=1 Tax=Smallanthus sonchifolius TaxID=185202 RepID=A0ACB9D9S4_9ASTR|nr:hypothetical protein L1987_61071 [Smallanthus sonchifolius]